MELLRLAGGAPLTVKAAICAVPPYGLVGPVTDSRMRLIVVDMLPRGPT
jgi:hypothetical protein